MAYMSDAKKILQRLEREALADAAVRTAAKQRSNQPSWRWTEPGYADARGFTVVSMPDWKQQRAWAYWTGSEYLSREQALALLAREKRVSLADVEPR